MAYLIIVEKISLDPDKDNRIWVFVRGHDLKLEVFGDIIHALNQAARAGFKIVSSQTYVHGYWEYTKYILVESSDVKRPLFTDYEKSLKVEVTQQTAPVARKPEPEMAKKLVDLPPEAAKKPDAEAAKKVMVDAAELEKQRAAGRELRAWRIRVKRPPQNESYATNSAIMFEIAEALRFWNLPGGNITSANAGQLIELYKNCEAARRAETAPFMVPRQRGWKKSTAEQFAKQLALAGADVELLHDQNVARRTDSAVIGGQ